MSLFHVCIHDVSPVSARAVEVLVRSLEALIGKQFSVGVVPDWNGNWLLTEHVSFCRDVRAASSELLLHGYSHRRARGWGPVTWLSDGSDEMNGVDRAGTRSLIERGQQVLLDVFGERARGFLPPAWRAAHVRRSDLREIGVEHVLGFWALESSTRSVPLATWSWDCGRWSWLGHVGEAAGRLLQASGRVPVLALHPRDVERGYLPKIVRTLELLRAQGYAASTTSRILEES